jgi:hypothetical protein
MFTNSEVDYKSYHLKVDIKLSDISIIRRWWMELVGSCSVIGLHSQHHLTAVYRNLYYTINSHWTEESSYYFTVYQAPVSGLNYNPELKFQLINDLKLLIQLCLKCYGVHINVSLL